MKKINPVFFYNIPQINHLNPVSYINSRYYLNYKGPHSHIISVTRKCNNLCDYCIADADNNLKSMNFSTGKKIIDFIFTIPVRSYYIEFTGGEPFINYRVMSEIIKYAYLKSIKSDKKIHFSIVSNLNQLRDKDLKLILKYRITVCTSIDGPLEIHNLHRSDSYLNVTSNIKKLIYYADKGLIEHPNIITTVTRDSLSMYKEIIDQYIKLNIMRVQLGFIEPHGRALKNWEKLGYSYKDYLAFYKKSLEYIVDINIKKGIPVYEKGAYLVLNDILRFKKMKQRSIDIYHRLAYDINGNIYPSDEARIIGESGDKSFLIANVKDTNSFEKFIIKEKTKEFMLDNFQELTRPLCARCNYFMYCKVGGYYNYITQKSFYGNMLTNDRCKMFKGIFEILLKMTNKPEYLKVFNRWLETYR